MVNDLLQVARLQNKQLSHNKQITDIHQLISDVWKNISPAGQSKGLYMRLQLPAILPVVKIDALLIKEAIQNVIDNAIDYSFEQKEVSCIVTLQPKAIVIKVRNTGIGLTKKDLTRIFEQFYRSYEALKMKPNGSGLGLYLARIIFSEYGGLVTAQMEREETVFRLTLPSIHSF